MKSDLALIVRIERAKAELAEARTIVEIQDVRAQSFALSDYIKRQGAAKDAALDATRIRLMAERRIGELLREKGEMRGGPNCHGGSLPEGISHKQSSAWQRIATLPAEEFESGLSEPEPTTKGLLRRAASVKARETATSPSGETCTVRDLHALVDEGKRFGTIYADPPWCYGNQATRASTDNHYSTMSVEDICALPVADLAAENAHCHLWTTNAFLRDAFDVMEAWGFTYKSVFVWVKPQMGIGNYWRVSHEFMLFGIRGKSPFRARDCKSWMELERTRHSAKPEVIRGVIERVSPGPYLELFGRRVAQDWAVWGNEIQRDLLVQDVREM